jgi:hypothetical protein
MKIQRTILFFIVLLLPLQMYGAEVLQIDCSHIQEYKANIDKRANRNWFLKKGIYTTVALVAIFSVYNYFKEPSISNEKLAQLLKLLPDTGGAQETLHPKTFGQKCIDAGSNIASIFCNGALFVAQNVVLTVGAESVLQKSERILKFPGNITWFVSHETDLDDLLQDYTGYGTLLTTSVASLQSNVDRAREGITAQLACIIDSVERLLAYMEYIHPKLVDKAQQESLTVQEYLTHATNEFVRAASEDELPLSLLASKIHQFVTEIKSLCHRFLRLQNRRVL